MTRKKIMKGNLLHVDAEILSELKNQKKLVSEQVSEFINDDYFVDQFVVDQLNKSLSLIDKAIQGIISIDELTESIKDMPDILKKEKERRIRSRQENEMRYAHADRGYCLNMMLEMNRTNEIVSYTPLESVNTHYVLDETELTLFKNNFEHRYTYINGLQNVFGFTLYDVLRLNKTAKENGRDVVFRKTTLDDYKNHCLSCFLSERFYKINN